MSTDLPTHLAKAQAMMVLARQALRSCEMLMQIGDNNGACNRAYYAMFDAARALLFYHGYPKAALAKTHSGLLSAFSEHFVKNQLLPAELGKFLKQAEEARLLADYQGDPFEPSDAQRAFEQAQVFVNAAEQNMAA